MAIPIRIIIPLLLFTLLSFQAVYLYIGIKKDIADEIIRDNKDKIAVSLRLIQDNVGKLYSENSIHLIKNELSKIATDPYITLAAVTDENQEIIAATNHALHGKSLSTIFNDTQLISDRQKLEEIIELVARTRRGYVEEHNDGGNIYGVYPVELGVSRGSLRPDRIGMVIIVKELSGLYAEAENKLLKKFSPVAIVIVLILLAFSVVFYYLVGRRLSQLEQATIAISEGNNTARVESAGNDELGKLGQALNTMAERIQIGQDKLNESERQLQNLAECSPVGIFRTDIDGNCIYVNRRWLQITGMTTDQAMGLGWRNGVHPDDLPRLSSEWENALKENRRLAIELRFRNPEHGSVWVHCLAVSEINHTGDKIGYIGTISDITERMRYQSQLEQQSMIINQTNDSVILTDLDGFITSWNKGAEKLFGHATINAVGRHLSFVCPDDEKEFLDKRVFAPVRTKGRYETEIRMTRNSGEVFYANASMSLLRDSSGKVNGIINYIIDITNRKRTEEELSRSEASLSEAQRIARLGNWSWDIVNDKLEWSDEIYRIFGLNPQQFDVNRDAFFRLVHPDDRPVLAKAIDDSLYNMAPYSLDHRICLPDRSVRYVHEQAEVRFDDHGNPLRMIGTIQDITDRVFAERALKRSETRFRSTFEQAAVGVAHVAPDGTCLLVNQRLCDIVGYSRDELMRLSFVDITHKDDVDVDRDKRMELVKKQRQRYSVEKRYIKSNGDPVWTNLTVSLVHDNNNRPDYFICVVEDISARKAAEEKIERTLKEKESLLQELHHRVKNNMQVISSILSLQSRNINSENIQRIFDESRQRIKAMALVHERLYSSGDLGHIDIKEYLEYLASKLKGLHASSNKEVLINVAGASIQLPVDTALPVALIVNELLTNAIYHAYPDKETARVDIELRPVSNNYYRIQVRDFGAGFDEQNAAESDRSSGLAIIRALTAQIHADVVFDNNKGTLATVSIPVDQAGNQALAS